MRTSFLIGLFALTLSTTALAGPSSSSSSSSGSGYTTVKSFNAPSVGRSMKVSFQTQGVKLNGSAHETGGKPQEITMAVPSTHQNARLAHIELKHSQSLSDKTKPWSGKKADRDTTAPYSQVEVHVEGKGWTNLGQAKKFAEARQETERLHDLPDAKGAITAVRVRNVGIDPVRVHDVTLHFLPQKPAIFDEAKLTPTTSFGDAWKDVAPRAGRDRAVKVPGTRYPGGVTLNNGGQWSPTSSETLSAIKARGWTVGHDHVSIPLQAGKRFTMAEIAIGDTQPDADINGDGTHGRKGYAVLSVSIEKADGSTVSLSSNENIPSEGVMVGTADHVVQAGDKLRIHVGADTAGLMGVRLGYDQVSGHHGN